MVTRLIRWVATRRCWVGFWLGGGLVVFATLPFCLVYDTNGGRVFEKGAGMPTNWTVDFIGKAKREFLDQPKPIRAKFERLFAAIEDIGLHEVSSKFKRQVQGKIWELRVRGPDTFVRALYLLVTGRRVMIVVVFTKKGPKTPRDKIQLALKRAKEVRDA